MATKIILTGDVNLMNVTDPAVPFTLVRDELRAAEIVFCNLECCLYRPAGGHSTEHEGFFADPDIAGEALLAAGIQAVGLANNVNYGEAAIMSSIERLDRMGIAHTGAGVNREIARAPAILARNGVRFGFLQRSSVYWPTNHEAGKDAAGIAVIRGHTAYHVPMHGSRPPANRPGIPPEIVTWADPGYLQWLSEDIAALRARADIIIVSFHCGLHREVLQYMTEIGHRAIDAGADLVIGHGPHFSLPIEVYKGKPIFYGLGSFSFHTGHGGRQHGDWLGMMVRASCEGGQLDRTTFQFVRHDQHNRTVLRALSDESEAYEDIFQRSLGLGAKLSRRGDEVEIELRT
ncbi:MAG: CapA family protein [Alphaproteobacteria bacterium]|nr:CapA family protein [Alphaproteobacteria bacterium]